MGRQLDEKILIAAYVVQESDRINQRLKQMVLSSEAPSEEECNSVMTDIEETLSRLQRALSQVELMEDGDEDNESRDMKIV